MIKINKLFKHFGKRIILDSINLELPDKGVIALVGASGSGKTTLLNAIGGVDLTYNGTILINGTNLASLKNDELSDYRLRNIGYVFQNFNLINLETVYQNIKLPLDSSTNVKEHIKKKRIKDILQALGIQELFKKQVNKLSGGEKQRVAIAKAMINSPKLLLCDEPTGALDSKNSEQIFKVLKGLSKNALVIIATHDLEGVSKIADQIIKISDGKVLSQEIQTNESVEGYLPPLLGGGKKTKKSALPIGFQMSHAFHKIGSKKFRFIVTNFMLSLSLTGIGMSLILTSSVKNKLESSFSEIVNGNQIVMEMRQNNGNMFEGVYTASEEKLVSLSQRYANYIGGIGATYQVNFEDFFKDKNEVYIATPSIKYKMPSFSMRSFNDFKWINEMDKSLIVPNVVSLDNDEVVMGINYADMVNLCFSLKILRNYNSLADYLFNNFVTLNVHVKNNDWQYEDEQIFHVVGVFESNEATLCHTNLLWNKHVFEDLMRFPSNDGTKTSKPWEMSRLLYFHTVEDPKKFLDAIFYDEEAYDYVFERTSNKFHPLLCKIGEVCKEKRVLAYYVDKKAIRPNIIKNVIKSDSNFNDYYFVNDFGYASYASNFLSGFAKNLFVSIYEEKIDAAIDADTVKGNEEGVELSLPKGVIQGNFMNSIGGGLRFSNHPKELLTGRLPLNNNEIAISYGLALELDNGHSVIDSDLILAGEVSESLVSENNKKEYRTSKAKIVGIVNEEKHYLYHDHNWTISFFRDNLGVSMFYLTPKSVVFELNENVNSYLLVEKLNKTYRDYIFSNPVGELAGSLNTTMDYAQTILMFFSVLASLISILLLSTVLILSVLESKQEVKIFKYTGIRKRDIISSFVSEAIVQTLISFFFSMFEMIVIDFAISYSLDNMLGTSGGFILNPMPILIVLLISVIASFTVSQIVVRAIMNKRKRATNLENEAVLN